MRITREDNRYLVIENKPYVVWIGFSLLGIGFIVFAVYAVLNFSSQFFLSLLPMGLFPLLSAAAIYKNPLLRSCFDQQQGKLVVTQRWPWGSRDEVIDYQQIQGLEVGSVFSRSGRSYRPVVQLRDGRSVLLSHESVHDEAKVGELIARLGRFLGRSEDGKTGELRNLQVAEKARSLTPLEITLMIIFAVIVVVSRLMD